jgi:hypothetical protein
MRSRAEVAKFINAQFHFIEKPASPGKPYVVTKDGRHIGKHWHYGLVELKALMDFIYGGPPASPDEEL